MKKAFILLLCSVMLLLTACQPTPEKPPVISGGEEHLNEVINSTPAPADIVYNDPDHKTDEFTCLDPNITITVDADIVKPDTHVFPVYHAEADPIPDGFIKQIAERLHPDVEFYHRLGLPTVEELEARLEEYTALISDPDKLVRYYLDEGLSRELAEENAAETRADYENSIIPNLRQQLKEARENPDGRKPAPSDFALHPYSFYNPDSPALDNYQKTAVAIGEDENGKTIRLNERWFLDGSDHSVKASLASYAYGDSLVFYDEQDWKMIEYTEDEARAIAEAFVGGIGLDDYALFRTMPCYHGKNYGDWWFREEPDDFIIAYHFFFCKAVNGVPVVKSGIVNEYAHVQDGAELIVSVTNDGVSRAFIRNWWELGEVENENVPLLSFDEAYESFVRQARVEYSREGTGAKNPDGTAMWKTLHIYIRRIQLVYCAIQSVGGGYTMVPAWMFCGEECRDNKPVSPTDAYSDALFDQFRYMIINAIDGSRISGSSYYDWSAELMW